MNRIHRRHRTLCDQYRSGQKKPPTRAQARAWLAPIRKAFIELLGGEVDAVRGYAITRIRYADEDFRTSVRGVCARLCGVNTHAL